MVLKVPILHHVGEDNVVTHHALLSQMSKRQHHHCGGDEVGEQSGVDDRDDDTYPHGQEAAVLQEVDVLCALYGDDNVIVSDVAHIAQGLTCVSVDLSTHITPDLLNLSLRSSSASSAAASTSAIHAKLSIRLPPTYPDALPFRPTLSLSHAVSSSAVRHVVDVFLSDVHDHVTLGEVMLFPYIERLLTVVNAYDFKTDRNSNNNDVSIETSVNEGADESLPSLRVATGYEGNQDIDDDEIQTMSIGNAQGDKDGSKSGLTHAAGQGNPESGLHHHIHHAPPLIDRKSVFQAHACAVPSLLDVDAFLITLRNHVAGARKGHALTHMSWAACLPDGQAQCNDDGEKHAGKIILDVLQHRVADTNNQKSKTQQGAKKDGTSKTGKLVTEGRPGDGMGMAVAVCRWFGGTKLGPVRFRHIAAVTRDAIDLMMTEQNVDMDGGADASKSKKKNKYKNKSRTR